MIEFTANGGDGYSMLSEYEVDREALITDTDALGQYIEHNLNGIIPEKYAKFQGRINIVNGTNGTNQIFNYFRKKNSGRGLSTGGIIAIIISCVVVLIAITALFFICKAKNPPSHVDNTSTKINIKNYVNN